MGAPSRGGRASGFDMGAASSYYADQMRKQQDGRFTGLGTPVPGSREPSRGPSFKRDPRNRRGLSFDPFGEERYEKRRKEAQENRAERVRQYEEQQAKERAEMEQRYRDAPPTVGTPSRLTDIGVEKGENPLLSAPKEKSPFASDLRYGDYGIAYRPEYEGYAFFNPGDPNVGKEGTPGGYQSLYGSLEDAEKKLQEMLDAKKADPSSYQALDYDSAGKRVGFDPTKEKSATGTLLEDPSAVKDTDRSESILINVPKTPTTGGSELDYKMGDDPDKVYMMGSNPGGSPEEAFQQFLDKAKADKAAFMAQVEKDEASFGQRFKDEKAKAFADFRKQVKADRQQMERDRGGRGQFRGFGDADGPIGGRFGGGRMAGGGVRGSRGGRGTRGSGRSSGSVRGAR